MKIVPSNVEALYEEALRDLNAIAAGASKLRQAYAKLQNLELPSPDTEDGPAFKEAMQALGEFQALCRGLIRRQQDTSKPDSPNEYLHRIALHIGGHVEHQEGLRNQVLKKRREEAEVKAVADKAEEERKAALRKLKAELAEV